MSARAFARRPHRVSTPTVLQMESMECGAAALGMVLGFYRRFVPLEELRVACGVSRDGVKISHIRSAATEYGLDTKALQLTSDQALKLPPPFIAFWNNNHFVVVEGASHGRVFLNDPASGRRSVSRKDFDDSFSHVVLTLKPTRAFKQGGKRAHVFTALLQWTSGTRLALLMIAAISLLAVAPAILLPAFLKVFVDEVLVQRFDGWLFPLLLGLVIAAILNAALVWFQQTVLLRLQMKFAITLSARFLWHLLQLPITFFTQRYAGDIVSRVSSANFMAGLLSGPMPEIFVNVLTAAAYALILALFSPELTAIALGLTALNMVAVGLVQRRLRDLNASLLNTSAKVTGAAMAGLQSMETIKATGTESDFFRVWSGYQTNSVTTSQRLHRTSVLLNAMPTFLSAVTTAAVLSIGALLIISGSLSIGGLVAFQMLLGHFVGPVHQLIGFNTQVQEATGHVNRLNDVFLSPTDPLVRSQLGIDQAPPRPRGLKGMVSRVIPKRRKPSKPDAKLQALPAGAVLSGRIELRDVSFAFTKLDPPFIKNVNISIEPGQRIALVGPSGSGKSTLLRLLLGLYQPTDGVVLYDGKPIHDVGRQAMTASVAWVDQDIYLFEGTVVENLTLWDDLAPWEAVVDASKDACIHEAIIDRAGGYGAKVQEGGRNFSGGQRQRLEIARALARQPSIIVLDEATSALDAYTEATVNRNIQRRGITSINVAHRLSTIRDCEMIYVIKDGQVVEQGGHRSLMRERGLYAELVSAR
ncbi:MAG: NHLP family bacteriocin export ABC transporter peptidase/permease/ATPase subunit [Devosia sp.]